MAQFDVVRLASGAMVVDCQADCFADLGTRLVAPLLPVDRAPPRRPRLNPVFALDTGDFVMVTQFATTVPLSEFADPIASLEAEYLTVISALDMLITGV
ncbi:CcdB family protein [Sphingomonas canadensis]|uniref:Toxin CcdB n=1 Tax=Sphingomonas canadensis TaxID=1219257 RepID=A0ABW3H6X5_9SPHN|nr:CcdB family protein [Sphingomonas canadensis]MCW3834948.1 CcdB family protein [Sphingomonas canadensis]